MGNKTTTKDRIAPERWVLYAPRRANRLKIGIRNFRWRARTPVVKRIVSAAAAALLFSIATPRARAAFDTPPIGAQSSAMGGASLASRGDPANLFLNPAGMADLRHAQAYFLYNRLYAGLGGVGAIGQGFAALGVPTRIGSLGVGFGHFQASGLLEERVIGLTYARRLGDSFQAGVTGKYLYHRYLIGSDPSAANDPVFRDGAARGALSLDVGASANFTQSFQAGLAVRNVTSPDVGLATEDKAPREIQAGLAYDVEPWRLRWTADFTYRDIGSGTLRERGVPAVGLEKRLENDAVKFRVGAGLEQFSGGVGVRVGLLTFDYAFILSRNLVSNNAGTHMIGVRYQFGGDASAPSMRSH